MIDNSRMTVTSKKLLITMGMAVLMSEYIEDVMDDPEFTDKFVRELKRDAKNYIRSCDKLISAMSREHDGEVREQLVSLYKVISHLLENGIIWGDEEKNITEKAE